MVPRTPAQLEAYLTELEERVRREIRLIDEQITKSKCARGGCVTPGGRTTTPIRQRPKIPVDLSSTSPPPALNTSITSPVKPESVVAKQPINSSAPTAPGAAPGTSSAKVPIDTVKKAASPSSTIGKAGVLLNFGKTRVFQSFTSTFVAVDDSKGILWWDSQAEFQKNPSKPKESIPFFEMTSNSRASKFKKAVVCWPLILPEDCSKATDPSLFYFGVEYYNVKSSKSELLVLGAASDEERTEWVTFLTKYMKLFLANREESEKYVGFAVGSTTPLHVSCVVDGEAPR